MRFRRLTTWYKRRDPTDRLSKAGNSRIGPLWAKVGKEVLDGLPLESLEYCLDEGHSYLARYSEPQDLEETEMLVSKYLAHRSAGEVFDWRVAIESSHVEGLYLDIGSMERIGTGFSLGESLRVVRTGVDEFRACVSSSDHARGIDAHSFDEA